MLAADLTTTAKHRHTDAPKLIHLVRGDLDWVVMKALEKDRTRRYETANGLAMDIQRHLSNEPVTACPPSRLYEFQKTVQRHKFGFAAAAALILVLGLGVLGSTLQAVRATRAEQEQSRLRQQAQAEAAENRRIAAFIGDLAQTLGREGSAAKVESTYRVSLAIQMRLLSKEHPGIKDALSSVAEVFQQGKLAEADKTAREAVQKCHAAMAQFETLASDRNHHYESWLIAVAYKSLGGLFQESGQSQEAEEAYRDTLVLWRKLAADSNLEDDGWQWANNYERLGDLLRQTGRATESLEAYRAAQAILVKLVADFNTEDRRWHLAGNCDVIGSLLNEAGRFDDATEACRQALVVWKKLVAEFNKADYRNNLSGTMFGLAKTLEAAGKRTEAELSFQEAESAMRKELPIQRKELGRGHAEVIRSVSLLSELLGKQGKLTEQESVLQEQLGMEAYPTQSAQENLGHLLWQQGSLHLQRNDFTNAARGYDQAVQTFKQLQTRFPENRYYRQEQAFSLRLFADAMQRGNRLAEAEASLRTAWDIYMQLAKEAPTVTFYSREAAFTRRSVAEVLSARGKLDEAKTAYRAAAETGDALALNEIAWTLATAPDPKLRDGPSAVTFAEKAVAATKRKNPLILDTLAAAYAEIGQFTNATRVQQEAIVLLQDETRKKGYASRLKLYELNTPYRDPSRLAAQASALLAEERFADAEPPARECLALREALIPDDWRTFHARSMVAGSLLGQKKYAEAEPLLLSGYEGMKQREDKIPANGKVRLQESLQRLVQLYEATGQSEKAAEWNKKLAEFDQDEKKAAGPKQ